MPEEERAGGLLIWKCHHSFCDGVSVVCLTLALSMHYDKSYFIKPYTQDVPLWQTLFIRLMTPFYLPKIYFKTLWHKDEDNCFTKKKNAEGLSGAMNVSSCLPIALEDIKRVSQAKDVTINDVVLCALTTSMNVLFKEK